MSKKYLTKSHWAGFGLGTLLLSAVATVGAADGLIRIEPATATPDDNGVVRFGVYVEGVPEPGLRSFDLTVGFEGATVALVDDVNTLVAAVDPGKVTCSAVLKSAAPTDTVVPGLATVLQSGLGQFFLDSVGTGTILFTTNGYQGLVGGYNFGAAGASDVIN
ncbi:MAG: hypothetical protein JJ992_17830, partial [Planctomycetes bacterium]|nr:hypothetical protein [Planctomycetota bacterium]